MDNSEARLVLHGKEDYLFLTNDTNNTIDQIAGTLPLPASFGERWANVLRARVRRHSTCHCRLLFLIAPMKEVVFSSFLPDGVRVSLSRPVSQVIAAAAEAGLPVVYPVSSLRALSDAECVYPKGDTHWTALGAYHAYDLAMRALGVDPLPKSAFQFHEQMVPGDLSGKLGQLTRRVEVRPVQPATVVVDNGIIATGNLKVFENNARPGVCLVFRDSFTHHLEPLLAGTFGKTIFVWQPNIDQAFIAANQPDVILNVMAERFLVNVPDDEAGPSNAEFVRRKQAGLKTGIVER